MCARKLLQLGFGAYRIQVRLMAWMAWRLMSLMMSHLQMNLSPVGLQAAPKRIIQDLHG